MFDFIKRIKKGLDLLEQTEERERKAAREKANYEKRREMLIDHFSSDDLNVFIRGNIDGVEHMKKKLNYYIHIIRKSGCVGSPFGVSMNGLDAFTVELKIIFNFIFYSDSMVVIVNNSPVDGEELLNKLIKFKNDSKVKGWGTKEERQRFRSLASGMMCIPDEEFIERDLAKYQEQPIIKNLNKKGENNMTNNLQERIEKLKNSKIITIDAESNGLWGQPFAIAAVVYDEQGKEINRFVARCPIVGEVNEWVANNVLPKMEEVLETHKDYESMLRDFFTFSKEYYKNGFITLTHMGQVVESRVLKDAHDLEIIGDWDAPYEWFDVCLLFGDSVDTYNAENEVEMPVLKGGTHNPLYDAMSAYKAFRHLITH